MKLKMKKLNRIWHNHTKWEDNKNGMYRNVTNKNIRNKLIKKVIFFFNNKKIYSKFMEDVIINWKFSCEHNLTNSNLNCIAWLGQASACLFCNAPEDITREAWNLLSEEKQNEANKVAEKKIIKWNKCQKNI